MTYSPSLCRGVLTCFLILLHSSVITHSFTAIINTHRQARTTFTQLFAKKQQQQSKKKKAPAGGGGGGFGSSKNPDPFQGKIRTVSGFTGSGTRPLRQAANAFDALREEYGKECCHDLYCKSPLNDPDLLWFVGKVAVQPDTVATPDQAVIAQKRIILEYAKIELRPQNLAAKKEYAGTLELWLAPGDSEMDCVQNKARLQKVEGSAKDLHDDFVVAQVGFNPEIYVGDERERGGLRIRRDAEGNPIKAVFDINEPNK